MKHGIWIAIILMGLTLTQAGCGRFTGGAAVGALGAGAAYEYQTKRQLDRLEEDYREGRITREEYESRQDQIRQGSIIY